MSPRPPARSRPIRTVVIDDVPLLVDLLAAHLGDPIAGDEATFTVVGTAHSLAGVAELMHARPVELALVDFELGDGRGTTALRALRRISPPIRAVLFSQYDDDDIALDAARAGFDGFLTKRLSVRELRHQLASVMRGGTLYSKHILAEAFRVTHVADQAAPTLTTRERQTLQACLDHGTLEAAASVLGISVGTVRNHAANASAKLGATTRVSALSRAISWGLITAAHQRTRR